MKKTMTITSIIMIVERVNGGIDNSITIDMPTDVKLFFTEINNELNKIVEYSNTKCTKSLTHKNCMKILCPQNSKCLNTVCKNCLSHYYAAKYFTPQRLICKKYSVLEFFFANADFKILSNGSIKMRLSEGFKMSHGQLKKSIELTGYIDF